MTDLLLAVARIPSYLNKFREHAQVAAWGIAVTLSNSQACVATYAIGTARRSLDILLRRCPLRLEMRRIPPGRALASP
jgi:hypothetical protein